MVFDLKGVVVPTITPFTQNGDIDHEALKWLVEFLINHGVHGLFPGGTTGEGPLLSTTERFFLAESVVEIASRRVPIIIHAGAITTRETIQLAQHALDIGADAIAVVPPYFYPYDDDALFAHFEAVLNSVPQLPVFIYSNPFILCSTVSPALVNRLVNSFENVVGIKDSSGEIDDLVAYAELREGKFLTFIGNDAYALSALSKGVDGCVAGNANVVPEFFVALYNAVQEGDKPKADELFRQTEKARLILGNGKIPLFKHALETRGIPRCWTRPPLDNISEKIVEDCRADFEAIFKNL
jgi:dihydrodipicolinate synthase/N-acetylneuraminate lyase